MWQQSKQINKGFIYKKKKNIRSGQFIREDVLRNVAHVAIKGYEMTDKLARSAINKTDNDT